MASVLRRFTPQFIAKHPEQAPPHVQSTLAKLELCRTAALGGRRYRCDGCETECMIYNSCGDRHCPQCAGSKRADWLDSAAGLLLEGVDYFQVVFTLPERLSSLALGNRRAVYNLLFKAGWEALRETIREEQGYEPAAAMVLHTWNQRLEQHAHLHALVPGGGPALDARQGWRQTRRRGRPSSRYLVDESALRRRYRDAFLAGLRQLHREGELKLAGEYAELAEPDRWEAFLALLASTKWVVYIEPPPSEQCNPEHVLKYLACYLTGGPISDRRLISMTEDEVTFWAREGTTAGGERKRVPVTVPGVEFVRRWALHILPKSYVKTRRFGGWSNRHREAYLEHCAKLLEACEDACDPETEPSFAPDEWLPETEPEQVCPHCGEGMRLVAADEPPSWARVMAASCRPAWYRQHL